MTDSEHSFPTAATIVRWTARAFSGAILLFWGFFIVAHIFGSEGGSAQSLTVRDYVAFGLMFMGLAGVAIAWWRELAGGLLAVISILVASTVESGVLNSPFVVFLITGLLFIASWWMHRPSPPPWPRVPPNRA